ncbi:hypothetical protein CDAR_230921 [Caerostris darwini]|uniref:Uncharacterized protein n=1 Tax=Caerostris darwini TaxID=1538125 RepID=A0AAV4S8T0_9ARAC|nr:hypothetical protein CDAR_230921 [Caerostris darwini]
MPSIFQEFEYVNDFRYKAIFLSIPFSWKAKFVNMATEWVWKLKCGRYRIERCFPVTSHYLLNGHYVTSVTDVLRRRGSLSSVRQHAV